MLERLGAFGASGLFERLMTVCACDYRAYAGRSGQVYPKAALLESRSRPAPKSRRLELATRRRDKPRAPKPSRGRFARGDGRMN